MYFIAPFLFLFIFMAPAAFALALGEHIPNILLKNYTQTTVKPSDFAGKTVIYEWTNYQCPFTKKHYESGNMQSLQAQFSHRDDIVWISVISSAPNKQGFLTFKSAPNAIKQQNVHSDYVILDDEGTFGKAMGALTTPHIFIADTTNKLIYQGAIDSNPSWKKETIATATNYVRQAMKEIKAGKKISLPITRPYGCSIKY